MGFNSGLKGLNITLFTRNQNCTEYKFKRSTTPITCLIVIYSRNDHESSVFLFIYTTTHCSLLRLIVRSGLDVPTSATRRYHARAPSGSGGRWNCGREMSGKFCLNVDFHVTFRDLLHAIKLRHVTDGFTSPPKEGVLRIFFEKSDGFGRV
jgi:hypothetical protein